MDNGLKVTSGSEWRDLRKNGWVVALPTGRTAKLRPATIEALLIQGLVPNHLAQLVGQMIKTGQYTPLEEDFFSAAKSFMELSQILAKEIMLEPKIVDNAVNDDEIEFLDLAPIDREFIIAWAQAPAVRLDNFREEQDSTVESA